MINCAECGHANANAQKFCGECGARLANRCVGCGTANPVGQKFCGLPPFGSLQGYTPRHLAERILTSKTALAGEHKQVTVLIADKLSHPGPEGGLDMGTWRTTVWLAR